MTTRAAICLTGALLLAGCGGKAEPPPTVSSENITQTGIQAGMMAHLFVSTDMACVRRRLMDRAIDGGWTVVRQTAQSMVLDHPTTIVTMGAPGPSPVLERMVLAFMPAEGGTRMHHGAALVSAGPDGAERQLAQNALSERQVALFQTAVQAENECSLSRMRPLR